MLTMGRSSVPPKYAIHSGYKQIYIKKGDQHKIAYSQRTNPCTSKSVLRNLVLS